MTAPRSILSRELLPASVAIFTTVAIVAFEGLAVTAALPDLTAELGQVHLLPWVITAFLLASGVTTAIAGSFIDSVGTSTVFRWATFAFAASSLAAAAASSMPMLVATRVFQGAAGGAIISVGVGAVALVYPSHLVGRAFAANSNVWGILGFAGPAIAAVLLQVGSWRWIFLLMVPISAVALIAGWRTLPGPVEPTPLRVDWAAVGLLVVTFGALRRGRHPVGDRVVAENGTGSIQSARPTVRGGVPIPPASPGGVADLGGHDRAVVISACLRTGRSWRLGSRRSVVGLVAHDRMDGGREHLRSHHRSSKRA
jgi:MFS family permease